MSKLNIAYSIGNMDLAILGSHGTMWIKKIDKLIVQITKKVFLIHIFDDFISFLGS